MDDYSLVSLCESKNEWCARLVNALTPAVIEGLRSIFTEADNLCAREDQDDKYLMTFQTYLSRIPKWNEDIIKGERERIEERSRCGYLEDLITCVHVVQLKALTCVRVGQKQKCVDLDIPSADSFVHKVYTLVARRLYTSVYLFEKGVPPLEKQKLNRELEVLVKECIMDAIRDSVPIERILKAYVAQTEEEVNEDGDGPPLPLATAAPNVAAAVAGPKLTVAEAGPNVAVAEAGPNVAVAEAGPKVAVAVAGPSAAGPSAAGPSAAGPSAAGPSAAAPVAIKSAVPVAVAPATPTPGASLAPAPGPKYDHWGRVCPAPGPGPSASPAVMAALTQPEPKTDEQATAAVKSLIGALETTTMGAGDGNVSFSNTDRAVDAAGQVETVVAPKDDAGLKAAEAAREARAPPVDDEPITLAIREMGGMSGLPDATLRMEDIEVLA
jgi:hypothetical protein